MRERERERECERERAREKESNRTGAPLSNDGPRGATMKGTRYAVSCRVVPDCYPLLRQQQPRGSKLKCCAVLKCLSRRGLLLGSQPAEIPLKPLKANRLLQPLKAPVSNVWKVNGPATGRDGAGDSYMKLIFRASVCGKSIIRFLTAALQPTSFSPRSLHMALGRQHMASGQDVQL